MVGHWSVGARGNCANGAMDKLKDTWAELVRNQELKDISVTPRGLLAVMEEAT